MKFSFVLIGFLITCLYSSLAHAGNCKIKSDTSLYLKGDTDAKMLACVEKLDLSNIDTVLLKSRGGSVKHALGIGELIAPLKANMIVKGRCNSSCANFFLPLASTVTVEAQAELLLHGSIDPGFAKKANQARAWEGVDAQESFAQKYKIHRGWLMYRNDYSNGGGVRFEYFDGIHGWPDADKKIRFLQVEPKLFESCFPHIPVVFKGPTLIDDANENARTKRKLIKNGVRPTGGLICKGLFDPNWPVATEAERALKPSEE